eukprot:5053610-Amphidinium_carterae.1
MPPSGPACVPGPKGHDTKAKEEAAHTHLGKDDMISLLPQTKRSEYLPALGRWTTQRRTPIN